jgi:hypothetical protein
MKDAACLHVDDGGWWSAKTCEPEPCAIHAKEAPCVRCETAYEDLVIVNGVVQGELCELCSMECDAQAYGDPLGILADAAQEMRDMAMAGDGVGG